jgi:hypothetical protein
MANLTSSSIANGSTIEASHITALYDVLTGAATYDNISITGNIVSASYALTASYAENSSGAVDTGSLLTTASISNDTITFTKGNASTFNFAVNNVVNANTASYVTSSNIDGIVNTAASVGPVFKDPNGGSTILQKGNILAIGSVLLSSGIGSGSATPILANLANGVDCYVMLTAASSMNPGEYFEASITTSLGQGRVAISDVAGNSNAIVSYVVFS